MAYQDPRVIDCLECRNDPSVRDSCPECLGNGRIRVPKRSESKVLNEILEAREREITLIRRAKSLSEIALIPCQICGHLWQDHSPVSPGGDRLIHPMTGPTGVEFSLKPRTKQPSPDQSASL